MIWNRLRIPLILLIIITALLSSLGLTTFMSNSAATVHPKLSKIGGYTTYYQDSTADRRENIRLAAMSIHNMTVAAGETISFNSIVGARTLERGYRTAPIISGGEYVMGVGGGVCQVSTTLYNAWITSGLDTVEVHSHSRPSHYVPLSRDAMVSSSTDMLLRNNQSSPLLITCTITNGALAIKIYGEPSEYEYNVLSIKLREVAPLAPIITYVYDPLRAGQQEVTQNGAVGFESRALLQRLRNKAVVDEKEIRHDYYLPSSPKINEYTDSMTTTS